MPIDQEGLAVPEQDLNPVELLPTCLGCHTTIRPEYLHIVDALNADEEVVPTHARCSWLCGFCDRRYVFGWMADHSVHGYSVCDTCFNQWRNDSDARRPIERCTWCNTHVRLDERGATYSGYGNSTVACATCYDDERECEDCSGWYHPDYDHDCDDSRAGFGVHSYGYKPSPIFFGNAPYHFGIELEVEAMQGDRNGAVDYLGEMLGNRAYLKNDGSLDCGFEIVTHPHSLQELQEKFPWKILEGLKRRGFKSWNTKTCGLHVHVSRSAFKAATGSQRDTHQIKFLKLIYDNKDYVQRLAGRKSSWAKFDDQGQVIRKVKDGYQSDGRYSAVNVQPMNTLEVRVFRGSLRKERVLAGVEFVHAAVEYTRNLPVVPKNNPFGWDNFMGYALSNNQTYPNLSIILNEMILKSQITISRNEEAI